MTPMKISLEKTEGLHRFTGYGDGYVEVNGARHEGALAVAGDRLLPGWTAGGIDSLRAEDVAALVGLAPELVLVGTGATFRFPAPALLAPLHEARIGVEVMDTRAACRTYNILLAEGRRVVAALLP